MSCCGQKRDQLRRSIPIVQTSHPAKPRGFSEQFVRHQSISFQYIGKTALTAVGPISGRHYRFSHSGAIVEVDPRDAPSLAGIPTLRKTLGS
jgi:hypothetical protein